MEFSAKVQLTLTLPLVEQLLARTVWISCVPICWGRSIFPSKNLSGNDQ